MITFVTTYYNEPDHLHRLLTTLNQELFHEFIIVDDGSEEYPAYDVAIQYPNVPLKLFKITEDLGFNSHGARNLAMKHVESEWALLSDIDRAGTNPLAVILHRYIKSSTENEYFHWMLNEVESVNDYCIRVKDFWISGGYDEEFVNRHYGDRIFIDRLNSYLNNTNIPFPTKPTRHARKCFYSDIDITVYPNDETAIIPNWDSEEKRKLVDAIGHRNDFPETWQRDNIIQFDWKRLI